MRAEFVCKPYLELVHLVNNEDRWAIQVVAAAMSKSGAWADSQRASRQLDSAWRTSKASSAAVERGPINREQ